MLPAWRSRRCSAPRGSIRSTPSSGTCAPPPSRAKSGEVLFEQTNCEIPASGANWPPTSSSANTSTAKSARRERENSVRQLDPSRQPHDRRLGHRRRLLRQRRRRRALLSRADLALPASARRVQFARLVQRRPVPPVRRQGRAVQLALGRRRPTASSSPRTRTNIRKARPASSRACTTTWKTSWSSPAARPCCSSSAPAPAPTCRRSARTAKSSPAAASPRGPLSFMRVYDQIAAVVKSGGKTRRAAKMQSLKVWHPDIMEFIECKAKEEKKARVLIEKGGYEANFNGEAYSSILFQNANLSVRVSDEFMQAVDRRQALDHALGDRPDARPARPTRPATCCASMAECAWHCGDPGVQYDTTINRWHTCPNIGPDQRLAIRAREYMFLDDTACNLASINLMKFRQRRRHVRRRAVPGRLPHLLHRPGNSGRSRQLSDQANRREQPPVPPAGPGLLEPGQPDHDRRHAVRFATRPAACAAR